MSSCPCSRHVRRRASAAFTLVELLTVIAIIAVLAAILIPAVSSVRKSARWAQGSSNIRQSTMGLIAMAAEKRGNLMNWNELKPNGTSGMWSNQLTQFLNGGDLNVNPVKSHAVLLDPLVDLTSNAGGVFHFASPDLQAPDRSRNAQFVDVFSAFASYRNIRNYPNPAVQLYLVDVVANPDGAGAHGNLATGDFSLWTLAAQNRSVAEQPINTGAGALGQVRWTDGKTKVGFMDGHVQILKQGELRRKHLNPALQ
ncbi:MAG: prepilin-type N-terminal cleavage/methylation domain-containing protein [Rariglobus sp.]